MQNAIERAKICFFNDDSVFFVVLPPNPPPLFTQWKAGSAWLPGICITMAPGVLLRVLAPGQKRRAEQPGLPGAFTAPSIDLWYSLEKVQQIGLCL